jgi:hypothetical protein
MIRFAVATACALAASHALAGAAASYTIVDLGEYEQPLAVNAAGTLVGYSDAFHVVPVIYEAGAWHTLPNLRGVSEALAINAKGLAVGYDLNTQVTWRNDQRKRLKNVQDGQPRGVADDGTIVGYEVVNGLNACYSWKAGRKTTLVGLGGSGNCEANAIDAMDAYVGGQSSTPSGADHAFLMDAAGTHDLGTLNGSPTSSLKAVNRHGHAAVWSTFDDSSTWGAAWWNGKRLIDLGLRAGGAQSLAMAIDDADDVLVVGADGAGHVLFLHAGRTGKTVALEPLIANPAGWTFNYDPTRMLTAIGNDGVIYGETNFQGLPHAYKLVPGTR